MTLTLSLHDALARQFAARPEIEREQFAVDALTVGVAFVERPLTAREVLALPADLRARLIEAQAEAMAPYIRLTLPCCPASAS